MHRFPKDKQRRRVWQERVRRRDWQPTEHSRLCSDHFEEGMFRVSPRVAESIGFDVKSVQLIDDAVPTIFARHQPEKRKRKPSSAIEKRMRIEVLQESLKETGVSSGSTSTDTASEGEVEQPESEEPFLHVPDNTPLMVDKSTQTYYPTSVPHKAPKAKTTSKLCQTSSEMKEKAVDTDTFKCPHCQRDVLAPPDHEESDIDESSDEDTVGEPDPDYDPLSDSDVESDCSENSDESTIIFDQELHEKPSTERKFLVYESCLWLLLSVCYVCYHPCKVVISRVRGTWLEIHQVCTSNSQHLKVWCSQPSHGTMPQGNLSIACGILFSGSSPAKVLNAFKHSNIMCFTNRTYNLIQQCYMVPAIFRVWQRHQQNLLSSMKSRDQKAVLGGDARCDSPGHSAKYSSYTMMDLERNKVINLELIQSNEVTSSAAMEIKGLKRSLEKLDREKIKIGSLTTDRHPSVKKYMRTERPTIIHWFDVWHVAKGVYKKLVALARKKKSYKIITEWAHSISNHLYWVVSSSYGNAELVKEKWVSILNHVSNIHKGHGKIFKKCLHKKISDDREWIKKGSKVHKVVATVIEQPLLMRDIGKLSPNQQTSDVECFHKVICQFAPKSVHFFYNQMKARGYLAALHYNANSERLQATTKAGEKQWRVSYPKYKKGDAVVKEIKTATNFDYIADLANEVLELRDKYPSYGKAKQATKKLCEAVPDFLSTKFVKSAPSKSNLIERHKSRFNKKD